MGIYVLGLRSEDLDFESLPFLAHISFLAETHHYAMARDNGYYSALEVTRLTGRTGRAIYARRKLLMLYRQKGSKAKSNRSEPKGNRYYETPRPHCSGLLSEVQEGRTVHRREGRD
jgi:hypothetical protein